MAFDRTDPAQLAALKSEVENDPAGVGYAPVVDQTNELLALLNSVDANPASDTVNVPFDEFPIIDALDEINASEYEALDARDKTLVDSIIQTGINFSDPNSAAGLAYFGPVKKLFRKAFGNQSNTWLAVKDDRARDASRAEALFGRDTILTREDWFAARDS